MTDDPSSYSDVYKLLNAALASGSEILKSFSSWRSVYRTQIANPVMMSAKDLIDVAGLPTRLGHSKFYSRPSHSAVFVELLEQRGAVFFAKTVTGELGVGLAPDILNPKYPHISPSGSSTGSATSIAGNFGHLSLTTDTCGSSRFPAANCGVVGLKLSQMSELQPGVFSISPTLDTLGLIAASGSQLRQAWHRLNLSAIYGKARPLSRSMIHVGLPTNLRNVTCDKQIVSALSKFLARVQAEGGVVQELNVPWWSMWRDAVTIMLGESAGLSEYDRFGALQCGTRKFLECARGVSAVQLGDSLRARSCARELARQFFASYDVDILVTPVQKSLPRDLSLKVAASTIVDPESLCFTALATIADLPALVVPISEAHSGAPIALQFIGGPGSDELLVTLAALLSSKAPLQ